MRRRTLAAARRDRRPHRFRFLVFAAVRASHWAQAAPLRDHCLCTEDATPGAGHPLIRRFGGLHGARKLVGHGADRWPLRTPTLTGDDHRSLRSDGRAGGRRSSGAARRSGAVRRSRRGFAASGRNLQRRLVGAFQPSAPARSPVPAVRAGGASSGRCPGHSAVTWHSLSRWSTEAEGDMRNYPGSDQSHARDRDEIPVIGLSESCRLPRSPGSLR
jgi:hypothetical protein